MPVYAPDLPVVGWYSGGTLANFSALIQQLNKAQYAGFLISGITGFVDTYPNVKEYFDQIATKKAQDSLQFARTHCTLAITSEFPNTNFFFRYQDNAIISLFRVLSCTLLFRGRNESSIMFS